MRKYTRSIEWRMIPASDKLFLRTAYKRYKDLYLNTGESKPADSFENWLLKRGINAETFENCKRIH